MDGLKTRQAPQFTFEGKFSMFKTASEVVKYIKDNDVKFLDVRFTDLPGVQQHFNLPASMIDEQFFVDGQLFDGSSIRGFASINESDMQLIPDVTTAYIDAFRVQKTLCMVFDVYNPRNGEIYGRDPRQTAKKAQAYLATTGIGTTGNSHIERGLRLTKNRGQSLEQFTLNGTVFFLSREAPIVGAVVGQVNPVTNKPVNRWVDGLIHNSGEL
jgi:glutamine synthetase